MRICLVKVIYKGPPMDTHLFTDYCWDGRTPGVETWFFYLIGASVWNFWRWIEIIMIFKIYITWRKDCIGVRLPRKQIFFRLLPAQCSLLFAENWSFFLTLDQQLLNILSNLLFLILQFLDYTLFKLITDTYLQLVFYSILCIF